MKQQVYLDDALMLIRVGANEGATALLEQVEGLLTEGREPELLISAMAIQGINLATMAGSTRGLSADEVLGQLNGWLVSGGDDKDSHD